MTVSAELGSQCSAGLTKLIGRSVPIDAAARAERHLSLIELHQQRRALQEQTDQDLEIASTLPAITSRSDNADLEAVLLSCPEPDISPEQEDIPRSPSPPSPPTTDDLHIQLSAAKRSSAPTLQPSSPIARCRRIGSAAHRLSTLLFASRYRHRSIICDDDDLRAHLLSLYDGDSDANLRTILRWFSARFRTTLAVQELLSRCVSYRTCLKRQLIALIDLDKANVSPSTSAMLFTSLCRALGRRARIVAALDPLPTSSVKLNERFQAADAIAAETVSSSCPCRHMFKSPYFQDDDDDDRPISTKRRSVSRFDCWVEIHDQGRWIPINLLHKQVDDRHAFEALLPAPPTYVIAIDEGRRMVDVVKRYASSWAAALKRTPARAWWYDTLLAYARRYPHGSDHAQECAELDAFADEDAMPTRLDEFRNHPKFAIAKFLKKYEVLYPDDDPIGEVKGHAVYSRGNVHTLHSKENWLRDPMRRVRDDEPPFKKVKSRSRKLDADELQSLYGIWQTEPWTPEPVREGVVPTSMYGHCELWTDRHLPAGAVHLSQPRIAMAARKCKVHFAPAMMGFESGTMGSVPIIQGIVTAIENKDAILAAYSEMEERRKANIEKRRLEAIQLLWRTVVRGTVVRHEIMIEKHAVPQDDRDERERHSKRARVQIAPVQHAHEFHETLDQDSNIWTSRCSCGLIREEEDL